MARLERKKYAGLDCLEMAGAGSSAALTVVLLHGYGADGSDLASLVQALRVPNGTRWLFPNGPNGIQLGPHLQGRAWFPIPMAEIERVSTGGDPMDFSHETPPGIASSRKQVLSCLDAAQVHIAKTCIGGFSQGAMLATDIALRSEENFAGLVVLSGTLVCLDQWRSLAMAKQGMRYFQSHGQYDPVLAMKHAERLNSEVFAAAGMKGDFIRFGGQHEIPIEVCSRLSSFLSSLT